MEHDPSWYLAVLVMTECRGPLRTAIFASPLETHMHLYHLSLLYILNWLNILISLVKIALCVTLVNMSLLFSVLEENISS